MELNTSFPGVTYFTSFLLVLLVCLIKFWDWKKLRILYYASKIPGPFALPFIGSLYLFILEDKTRYLDVFLKLSRKYLPFYKLWVAHDLFIVITRPEDVEYFSKTCLKKSNRYKLLEPGLGQGLITASVERWKCHRKILTQIFNQNILNSCMDTFVFCSKKLVDDLEKNHLEVDALKIFNTCTSEIIFDCSLGPELADFNIKNQYMMWIKRAKFLLGQRFFDPLLQWDFIWNLSKSGKEVSRIITEAKSIINKGTDAKKERRKEGHKITFTSLLMQKTNAESEWSQEEISDEAITFYVAGSETTAVTLSFLVILLSLNQDIQEKLFLEISNIFSDSSRDITLDDLNQMEYCERVIKETLRLFPVAPLTAREVENDVILDGIVIPAGSSVIIPSYCIHRDSDHWPDPENFNPDRFLPEEVEKRPRASYIPFNLPPRNCIGWKFAMMSMMVIVTSLIRRFKVVSSQYESMKDIKLHFDIITEITDGCKVTFAPRKNY